MKKRAVSVADAGGKCMEWVSSWIQGIIIAVIISTIIEMILPNGTSKKYIKVVIGVYILFSIVSPIITKITKKDFKVSDIFDLDEYIETSKNSGSMQKKLNNENENQIKELYLNTMKNDIKEKVESKGYKVNDIKIEVENDEQYTLKKINMQIAKNTTNDNNTENKDVETVNKIQINAVNIQNTNTENTTTKSTNKPKKSDITSQEKRQLKEYLNSVYEISTKKIFINE